MALKKCKECGQEVSTKANKCPKCGAPVKKRTGCLGWLIIIILGIITIGNIRGCIESTEKANKGTETKTISGTKETTTRGHQSQSIYKMKETATIGYTAYAVWRAWWSDRLSDNEFSDAKPDASFLFIELTVRNDDKKPRSIPPFKLIDENGAEYETSNKAWAVDGAIGVLDSLNPSVSKKGIVVFDVPRTHHYKLKISGGYWSGEDAFIEVIPE